MWSVLKEASAKLYPVKLSVLFGALLVRSTLASWLPRLRPPEKRVWSTQPFHKFPSARPAGFSHALFQLSRDINHPAISLDCHKFLQRNENLKAFCPDGIFRLRFFVYLRVREIYGWPARLLPGEVRQSWEFDLIRIQLPHPPGNVRIQILTGHALRVFRMRTLAIQYPDPWGKPATPNKENSPPCPGWGGLTLIGALLLPLLLLLLATYFTQDKIKYFLGHILKYWKCK